MRWLSALKLASFMTCALFAVMKSDVRAETDLVCHNEPDVALSRFLRSYEEAFDRLVVTRGLPQTHPYSSMLVDYFELDIAERVSLFPGMLFIIYHVEDGATCAFGWHNPVSAQDDIAREVVHTYVRGDGDPKALSVQIGSLVEAMQTVVMRGPARAPDRGATALFRSQIPSEADIDAVLADLSRALLIEQLEPVLSETNHLVAHLPGDLAAIPFLAMTRQDGAALVESHSLTSLDRLSRFLDKAYRYAQLDEQVNGRLVLLSDPTTPTEGIGGIRFPALPGAQREVSEIAALRAASGIEPEPLVVSGADVTAERMLSVIGDAAIIHFAGHGVGDPDNPLMQSFLALADGPLTAHDLQELSIDAARMGENLLSNVPLVVLSACETGRGQALAAGMVGLARSFQIAGAGGTILSHWAVSDESAAVLMVEFYRELEVTGMPEVALQRAMLRTRALYPHPSDWAAFSFFGLPGLYYGWGNE